MANPLTQMPSVWGDLGLTPSSGVIQNQELLSEQDKLLRKKKIMAAGSTPMMSAAQLLLGSRTGSSATVA